MANLLSTTTINDTGFLRLPVGSSAQRVITPTIIRWTSSGYTVIQGTTPAGISNSQFTVPSDVNTVEVLVVAGGGGGGSLGGGGGAGGLIHRSNFTVTPGAVLTVTVGLGGTGASNAANANGVSGQNSVFGSLTAIGGGGGNTNYQTVTNASGGSGGGGANGPSPIYQGGTAVAGQGYPGGPNVSQGGGSTPGGGGGAGGPGGSGGVGSINSVGRGGGPGLPFFITGSLVYYAGGGGGGARADGSVLNAIPGGRGGIGGGGDGGGGGGNGSNGTPDTGGGGGGGGYNNSFGSGGGGGSGIVVIRYYTIDQTGILRQNAESKQLESLAQSHGSASGNPWYNDATGGNAAAFGGWKTHYFYNTTSTFTPSQSGLVELLVVAGGGGGGGNPTAGAGMAGGGAGGVIYLSGYPVIAGTSYSVVAGTGGAGGAASAYTGGSSGNNSKFGALVAVGGGGGGGYSSSAGTPGKNGGSGGGGGTRESYSAPSYPGMGTTHQGNRGGNGIVGYPWVSAGGGGWSSSGGDATAGGPGGSGGAGGRVSINGYPNWVAGGGGGSSYNVVQGIGGGLGGFGGGGNGELTDGKPGMPGTGGGGGGGGTDSTNSGAGGAGGAGIVVVRYRSSTVGTGLNVSEAAPNALTIKELTGTTTDGLYWIMIPQVGATPVFCDMNTNGGGWMHAGTFSDSSALGRNDASHIWGAPLNPNQDTGLWENYTTTGSQSFTANFKSNVWCFMPFREILMKDSGNTLRNIWRTKIYNSTPTNNYFNSLSWFFGRLRWLANGSDTTATAGTVAGSYPFSASGRVVSWDVVNYGNDDPVFGSSTRILFKWGERNGVQDSNKDRSMISHELDVNVDAPKGIGCFTNLGGPTYYRNIVPRTEMTQDTPANAITGTHNLTIWVR